MSTACKSICCKESKELAALLVGDPAPTCITQHLEFHNACLCRTVLIIALHSHRHHHGESDVPTDEHW